MDLAAQSMDPSSRRNPWIAQISVDRAGYDLPIYRFFISTLPLSHFYESILLDRLPYVIGELLEVSAWYETHDPNNSNFTS